MNPMGVSGFLDNQSIESATLVNEATARGQELLNREREYGLMSGMTQRGMAADVAKKEKDVAHTDALTRDILYALEDKMATQESRRHAGNIKNTVEAVTGKAFLDVAEKNPQQLLNAVYVNSIAKPQMELAEKTHKEMSGLALRAMDAYLINPEYAEKVWSEGSQMLTEMSGLPADKLFGGVDFRSSDVIGQLESVAKGNMDVTEMMKHRYALDEARVKAGYDAQLAQKQHELDIKKGITEKAFDTSFGLSKETAINQQKHEQKLEEQRQAAELNEGEISVSFSNSVSSGIKAIYGWTETYGIKDYDANAPFQITDTLAVNIIADKDQRKLFSDNPKGVARAAYNDTVNILQYAYAVESKQYQLLPVDAQRLLQQVSPEEFIRRLAVDNKIDPTYLKNPKKSLRALNMLTDANNGD